MYYIFPLSERHFDDLYSLYKGMLVWTRDAMCKANHAHKSGSVILFSCRERRYFFRIAFPQGKTNTSIVWYVLFKSCRFIEYINLSKIIANFFNEC